MREAARSCQAYTWTKLFNFHSSSSFINVSNLLFKLSIDSTPIWILSRFHSSTSVGYVAATLTVRAMHVTPVLSVAGGSVRSFLEKILFSFVIVVGFDSSGYCVTSTLQLQFQGGAFCTTTLHIPLCCKSVVFKHVCDLSPLLSVSLS